MTADGERRGYPASSAGVFGRTSPPWPGGNDSPGHHHHAGAGAPGTRWRTSPVRPHPPHRPSVHCTRAGATTWWFPPDPGPGYRDAGWALTFRTPRSPLHHLAALVSTGRATVCTVSPCPTSAGPSGWRCGRRRLLRGLAIPVAKSEVTCRSQVSAVAGPVPIAVGVPRQT